MAQRPDDAHPDAQPDPIPSTPEPIPPAPDPAARTFEAINGWDG